MNHFLETVYRTLWRITNKNHLIIPTSKPSIKGTTIIQPTLSTENIDSHNPPQLIRLDPKKIVNEH